jgi:glycyl-tRNA synthetase beta chain
VSKDFLVEIGTEELPPKALRSLMDAFGENLTAAIDDSRLERGDVATVASPRRLAVIVGDLAEAQEDRKVDQKGPPVRIAFDDDGNPTPAAEAFAKKCGVGVDDLNREQTDKGEWLTYEKLEQGQSTAELLPGLVEKALSSLPIPRRMRWGDGAAEFVRPIHWVVMLHGTDVIDAAVMGIRTGNTSQGHRFHSDGDVVIASPDTYLDTLEKEGHVIAAFVQHCAYHVAQEVFRETRQVREIGECDLGLDHPELGEVAGRVRVFGAEGRAEGVDPAQRTAVGLDVELTGDGEECLAAEEILFKVDLA